MSFQASVFENLHPVYKHFIQSPPPYNGSLMATEKAARERARLNFLQELHIARTIGIEVEANTLLEHGRVVLDEEAVQGRHRCRNRNRNRRRRRSGSGGSNGSSNGDGGGGDGQTRESAGPDGNPDSPSRSASNNNTNTNNPGRSRDDDGNEGRRWVSHVCRELRRNRFAAQRAAMRRNVVPALAPSFSPRGREAAGAAGAGARDSPFSLPQSRTTTADGSRGRASAAAEARSRLAVGGSPTSPKSAMVLRDGKKRRV